MANIDSDDLVKLLTKKGFKVLGKRAKYIVLRNGPVQIIIPNEKSLAPNIVHTILTQANLSQEDLSGLHKKEDTKINKEESIVYTQSTDGKKMGFGHTAWAAESKIFKNIANPNQALENTRDLFRQFTIDEADEDLEE